jgi:hypothetical protein
MAAPAVETRHLAQKIAPRKPVRSPQEAKLERPRIAGQQRMLSIIFSGRPVRLLEGAACGRVGWSRRPGRPSYGCRDQTPRPKDRPTETSPVPTRSQAGTATNCRLTANAVNHCFRATGPATRGALASRELVGLDGRGGHPTGSNGRPMFCPLTWVRIHQHLLNGPPEIEYDGELIPSWSRLEPGPVG